MVYFCQGTDKEKLDWFKIINIAGEKLTNQELRDAVYTGTWLSDAKFKFSKSNCAAYLLANKYVNGSPIRQEYLETALSWINKVKIEDYMAIHQHDANANELWTYFKNVIDWVELTFTEYRKEMKGIAWGPLYDSYHTNLYNTSDLEKEINNLMVDDEVTNKKGIYAYVLTRDEKYLNLREFTQAQKTQMYNKQKGICPMCKSKGGPNATRHWDISEMEADHIDPWHSGGKTDLINGQMLCKQHNRIKSGR